jgi:hypothetical protein
MKTYTVFFNGAQSVEAETEEEARELIYDRLKEADFDSFECGDLEE